MQSLATTFALAIQTAGLGTKAPVATEKFYPLSLESLGATGIFDYIEYQNQSRGIHGRATTQQGTPLRSGFSVPFDGDCGLYPNSFGALLVGLGLQPIDTVDVAVPYTWLFKKLDICDAPYISAFLDIPDCGVGVDPYRKILTDARLTSITLDMSTSASGIAFTGFALGEENEANIPTSLQVDSDFAISPIAGSIAFSDLAFMTNPTQHTVTIARPVDEENQKMHSLFRASAEETGFSIMGEMSGVDLSYDLYKELMWADGATPDTATVTSRVILDLSDGQVVESSINMNILSAEVRFMGFRASGNDIVRCDVQYTMLDNTTTDPVVITVIDDVSDYPFVAP